MLTLPCMCSSDPRCGLHAGGLVGVERQRFPTAEAGWQAAWNEGRRIVELYQAELTQVIPSTPIGSLASVLFERLHHTRSVSCLAPRGTRVMFAAETLGRGWVCTTWLH